MATSSYCKKHQGQDRDCDRCSGPEWTVFGITMTCDCKCHKTKEQA